MENFRLVRRIGNNGGKRVLVGIWLGLLDDERGRSKHRVILLSEHMSSEKNLLWNAMPDMWRTATKKDLEEYRAWLEQR